MGGRFGGGRPLPRAHARAGGGREDGTLAPPARRGRGRLSRALARLCSCARRVGIANGGEGAEGDEEMDRTLRKRATVESRPLCSLRTNGVAAEDDTSASGAPSAVARSQSTTGSSQLEQSADPGRGLARWRRGWKEVNKAFFWDVVSGKTSWELPRGERVAAVATSDVAVGLRPTRKGAPCRIVRATKSFRLPARARDAGPQGDAVGVGINGGAPDPAAAEETAERLMHELALYSADLMHVAHLFEIVLVSDLHYRSQRRFDVPDLASGMLFIDVQRKFRWHLCHSFHHELWHMIDFRLHGRAYADDDAEFARLNAVETDAPAAKTGSGAAQKRGRGVGGSSVRAVCDSDGIVDASPATRTLDCCKKSLPAGLQRGAKDDRERCKAYYGFGALAGTQAASAMRDALFEKRSPPPPSAAFLNMYSSSSVRARAFACEACRSRRLHCSRLCVRVHDARAHPSLALRPTHPLTTPRAPARACARQVGEDKAEVWAALVLYPERLLGSTALMHKAGLLLARVLKAAPAGGMDAFAAKLDAARARRLEVYGQPTLPSHYKSNSGDGKATDEARVSPPKRRKSKD